jgi:uncharacterized protein (TIGR03086 family)
LAAEPLSQLGQALGIATELVTSLSAQEWDEPTPCSQWQVRDLVAHLVGGNNRFASAVSGEPAPTRPGDWGDEELGLAFLESGEALTEAFGQPGALDRVVTVPIGPVPGIVALHLRVTELLVHSWDLAQATGRSAEFPEDLAAQELDFSLAKLEDIPPDRRPFGPPQPVADDARAIDRLVACLGRRVS